MAYTTNPLQVQQVVVQLECRSQITLETYYLVHQSPTTGANGASDLLLANFITAYKASLMPLKHTTQKVTRWTMHEIIGAKTRLPVPPAGTPRQVQTVFDDRKKDLVIPAGVASDSGATPPGAELPLFACIGCWRQPRSPRRGYFEGSYIRFSPLSEADHDDVAPEQWSTATTDLFRNACEAFRSSTLLDVVGPASGWVMAIWSPTYFVDFVADGAGEAWQAAEQVVAWLPTRYVRTQVSRRYTTGGLIGGK